MNKLRSSLIVLSLVGGSAGWANELPFDATVGVASDYVYRGISQSGEDPAVNAGIKFSISDGWYARGFFSEVESRFDGNQEVEFAGGYQGAFNKDFQFNAELIYSAFTGEQNGDSDYAEATFSIDYKKFFKATLGFASDYYNTGDSSLYAEGRFNLPLHDIIKTEFYAGYNSLDDQAGESYALLGVDAWTYIGNIKFMLSFTDTDIDNSDNADSRLFVNASYQFK